MLAFFDHFEAICVVYGPNYTSYKATYQFPAVFGLPLVIIVERQFKAVAAGGGECTASASAESGDKKGSISRGGVALLMKRVYKNNGYMMVSCNVDLTRCEQLYVI